MTRLARLLTLCAVVVAGLAVSGCGNRVDVRTLGDTEGLYLDIGGLKYQVQMSRYLNAGDVEDKGYLVGVRQPRLAANETWFGVFLRVENDTEDTTRPAASDFRIHDTQGKTYSPVEIDDTNVFAYRPLTLGPGQLIPTPSSAAYTGPTVGSLLLFKITYASTQNRPLEFRILNPSNAGQVGIIDLDV